MAGERLSTVGQEDSQHERDSQRPASHYKDPTKLGINIAMANQGQVPMGAASPINPLLDMSQASAFPQIVESKITNMRTASPDPERSLHASIAGDAYLKGAETGPGARAEKANPTAVGGVTENQAQKNDGIDKRLAEGKNRASQRPPDGKTDEVKGIQGGVGLGNATGGSFQNLGQLPDLQNIDPSIMNQIQPLLEDLNNNPQIQNLLKEMQHTNMPLSASSNRAAAKVENKKAEEATNGQNKAQPEFQGSFNRRNRSTRPLSKDKSGRAKSRQKLAGETKNANGGAAVGQFSFNLNNQKDRKVQNP